MQRRLTFAAVLLALGVSACATPPGYDYSAWLEHPPRSILVLPPLDETVETDACYGALSTVTRPLVERGFYVFPVAVVDAMMRENGLPTAWEMHQVPLEKLREVFDPDAVLYLEVTSWGTSYHVLASNTTVALSGVLVDAETGVEIWSGAHVGVKGSGDGGGGLGGMLAAALVNQVATSVSDPSRDVSSQTAWSLFHDSRTGWLPGPLHPDHEVGLEQARAAIAEAAE